MVTANQLSACWKGTAAKSCHMQCCLSLHSSRRRQHSLTESPLLLPAPASTALQSLTESPIQKGTDSQKAHMHCFSFLPNSLELWLHEAGLQPSRLVADKGSATWGGGPLQPFTTWCGGAPNPSRLGAAAPPTLHDLRRPYDKDGGLRSQRSANQ